MQAQKRVRGTDGVRTGKSTKSSRSSPTTHAVNAVPRNEEDHDRHGRATPRRKQADLCNGLCDIIKLGGWFIFGSILGKTISTVHQ